MKLAIVLIVLLSVIGIDTKVEGNTMCDTGIEYVIEYREGEVDNRIVIKSKSGDVIFIVAIDLNKDGKYNLLVFDTVGDGMADIQLYGGSATVDEIIELYCKYINFTIS